MSDIDHQSGTTLVLSEYHLHTLLDLAMPGPRAINRFEGAFDMVQGAGERAVWSGQPPETMTARGARAAAMAGHASPVMAGFVADTADALAPIGVVHGLQMGLGIRAIRISLSRGDDFSNTRSVSHASSGYNFMV